MAPYASDPAPCYGAVPETRLGGYVSYPLSLAPMQLFTRLALQWILVKGFKLYSFQLPDLKRPGIVIFCHYLPVSGLGNLRACCLPWMW